MKIRITGLKKYQNAGSVTLSTAQGTPFTIPKIATGNPFIIPQVATGNSFTISPAQWQRSDQEIIAQANADLGMTNALSGSTPQANADGVFGQQLQDRVARDNPQVSTTPAEKKKEPIETDPFAVAMNNLTAVQAGIAAFTRQKREVERDRFIRNRNAQYNQQGESFIDRGNYGVGPTDYGLFRPNQQGVDSPEGQYSGGKFFQLGGDMELEKYRVPSIDSIVGSSLVNPMDFLPQMAPQEAPEFLPPRPVQPMETNFKPAPAALKEQIAMRESGGNYKALPKKKDGTLASSAAGKYQFLWNYHKDAIKNVTGVSSKQEFLNNPEAQEKYFDYWNATTLTPTAKKIKEQFNPQQSMDDLKKMVHFAGPQGAFDFFAKGKVTRDAFGTTNMSYLEAGGEYELTADEIMQIKAMGGDVEFI